MKRLPLALLVLLFLAPVAGAQMKAHFINVGQAESIPLEFKTAAVLIDAGREDTGDPRTSQGVRDRERHIGYLTRFFDRRADLNRTLHSIIISHPHIDHTRLLMNVMRRFRVRNLVDGGGRSGSGIGPLRAARQRAAARNIVDNKITDSEIRADGYTPFMLGQLRDSDSQADIRFLCGGGRDCDGQNNNSLTVRVERRGREFIFTGDSAEEDSTCVGGQVARLLERFDNASHTGLLDVDVYKVGRHGPRDATNEELLEAMSPAVAVISAGDEAAPSRRRNARTGAARAPGATAALRPRT